MSYAGPKALRQPAGEALLKRLPASKLYRKN